jgi:hypothetical protein
MRQHDIGAIPIGENDRIVFTDDVTIGHHAERPLEYVANWPPDLAISFCEAAL